VVGRGGERKGEEGGSCWDEEVRENGKRIDEGSSTLLVDMDDDAQRQPDRSRFGSVLQLQ